MAVETYPYDSARYLDSDEAIEAFLEAAFEDADPVVIAHALDVAARARRNLGGQAQADDIT